MNSTTTTKRRTPGRAIRAYCVGCVDGAHHVRECGGDRLLYGSACPFFPYRMGRGRPSVKTIRRFCLECMNGRRTFVADCTETGCLLHPYRMGKNPNISKDRAKHLGHGRVSNESPSPAADAGVSMVSMGGTE